jgi:aminoglycoside N3'-acetyltransferase
MDRNGKGSPDGDKSALTLDMLVSGLRTLGVSEGDVVMPHVSLRRIGLAGVPGGAERLLEALDRAVGPSGTLLMILGTNSPHEYVNQLPEDERAAALATETPFVLADAPVLPEVGAFAEVFRLATGTVQSDNPSGRYGARGAGARELVEGQPVDDYYGPGSPLERLVERRGKVLRIGSDAETVNLLHYAEYLARIENKRRVRWDYLIETAHGPRHVIIRCLDDMDGIVPWEGEDYFKLAVEAYEAEGHGRRGHVGRASAALYDAAHLVDFAARWMERELVSRP